MICDTVTSRALALGMSLPTIGKSFGRTRVQTTPRYAHLTNQSVKASGSRVGDRIGPLDRYHFGPQDVGQRV